MLSAFVHALHLDTSPKHTKIPPKTKMPRTSKRKIKTEAAAAVVAPKKRVTMKEVVAYIRQLENRIFFLQAKVTVLCEQRVIHHDCLNALHARVKKNTQGVEKNSSECMELQVSHAKDSWDTTIFHDEVNAEAEANWEPIEYQFIK